MNIRQWINDNPLFAGLGLVVLLVLGFTFAPRPASGPPRITDFPVWLYDESTGDYTVADHTTPGLRAAVFACGDCGDKAARFVAFLTNEEGEVRGVDDDTWHHGLSDEARQLNAAIQSRCEAKGKPARPCLPPR
ncbi:MAG: hypothetical protein JJU36_06500 [Phycisphaeraceae bacterium]|nr:hypothetical protein [Phycisphaeraceae bacterium]